MKIRKQIAQFEKGSAWLAIIYASTKAINQLCVRHRCLGELKLSTSLTVLTISNLSTPRGTFAQGSVSDTLEK